MAEGGGGGGIYRISKGWNPAESSETAIQFHATTGSPTS